MGNIRASSWLDYDATNEATELGKQSSTLASAKKSGGGWGALLGGIIGQILIPIPGVGAAIGAGLGGAAGSVAGGAMSGTSQDDIRGGKFYKNSRNDILDTIAGNQLDQSLMSAAKYGMMGLNPSSGLVKGTEGFEAGMAGGGGLMGGLKGAYGGLTGDATAAVLGNSTDGVTAGAKGGMVNDIKNSWASGGTSDFNILDITKAVGQQSKGNLSKAATTISGAGAGAEVFDTLDMAQNVVGGNKDNDFAFPYSQEYIDNMDNPDYIKWLEENEGKDY